MQAPLSRPRISFAEATTNLMLSLFIGIPLLVLILLINKFSAPDAFLDPLE